jgi:hypothetical protein
MPGLGESEQVREPGQPKKRAAVVEEYDRIMRLDVAPQLRAAGFTGTLRSFTMRRGSARGELRWEKDGRWVRTGLLRFTAKVDYWCGGGRIAELLPAGTRDTWWRLRDDEPTRPIAEDVTGVVLRYVLPAILSGLEETDRVADRWMYEALAHGAGYEPDGGGSPSAAPHVKARGNDFDWVFASFTSDQPNDRLHAACGLALAPDDPRTLPALLYHLERDPNPVIRKVIASRVLAAADENPEIVAALRRTADHDQHPGVRWAGRFALRVLQARV